MKSPILVCLLATSAMAVTPALAANTMAATPAPAATNMATTAAPAVKKPVVTPALDTTVAMLQVQQSSKFGKYLTDGNGQPLYMFSADKRAKDDVLAQSACTGACAVAWPPATIKNMPKSGSGIDRSDLSTIARADGTKQLTYDGRPLYLFIHDQAGAAPSGQALNKFGGVWHLVAPSGAVDQKVIG